MFVDAWFSVNILLKVPASETCTEISEGSGRWRFKRLRSHASPEEKLALWSIVWWVAKGWTLHPVFSPVIGFSKHNHLCGPFVSFICPMCPHKKTCTNGIAGFLLQSRNFSGMPWRPILVWKKPWRIQCLTAMAKHHAPWFHFSDTSALMFLLKWTMLMMGWWRLKKNAGIPNTDTGKHIAQTSNRDPTKHAGSVY